MRWIPLLGLMLVSQSVPSRMLSQTTIGTNESVSTELAIAGIDGWRTVQTFRPPSSLFLTQISFWFYGGETMPAPGDLNFVTSVYVEGQSTSGTFAYSRILPQAHQGRFDLFLPVPVAAAAGSTWKLAFNTDLCGMVTTGGCEGLEEYLTPIGTTYRHPMLEQTVTDAYADGYTYLGPGWPEYSWPDKDLRFSAVFVVPEPSSFPLLAIGALAFAATVVRRRNRDGAPKALNHVPRR